MNTDDPSRRTKTDDATRLLAKARALIDTDQWEAAARHLQSSAKRQPANTDVLRTLAKVYIQNEQYLPALQAFDRLIGTGQANAQDYADTGDALTDVGEYAQATGAYQQGLDQDANNPKILHNLARVLYRIGLTDQAADHLKHCTRHCDLIDPWLSLATIVPGCCQADHREILDLRRRFGARLARHDPSGEYARPPRTDKRPATRIHLGYLSAFFHLPNYMKPVWGLINAHRRDDFTIHLFSDSPRGSDWPGYDPQVGDRIHEIGDLDNRSLSELLQRHGIDILVDLNAYSTPHRLGLFLGHPTPVTMAWFNMYATSGLPGFDYIVGDPWVVRPDEIPYYTEKVLTLPISYLSFSVYHDAPEVVPPPCTRSGDLTFGSLVSQYKITPNVIDAWADILKQTQGTFLFLANTALKSKWNRQYVKDQFRQRGVDPERLKLDGPRSHYDFLRYYDQIDIALDAFPYNGGTTTMEAIWQGVPVLCHDGDRWASRTSHSLLALSPAADYVADTKKAMVARAVAMSKDPHTPTRLQDLRHHMRARLSNSQACNPNALAGHMETLYRRAIATIGR